MSKTKSKTTEKNTDLIEEVSESDAPEQKTCFIIMPIADHPSYENGHFHRVYEYLIKPACENAGYKAIRADDSKASHMIMFDILKKIVQCDMAICDLSTKNANVFYELGLRQAFNKKTILITDGKEKAPFDISGFRYVQYSPTLRVDQCTQDINEITEMLNETTVASENDVNSIVKLLEIEPARITPKALSAEDSLLFNLVNSIEERLNRLDSTLNKNQKNNIKIMDSSDLNLRINHNAPAGNDFLFSFISNPQNDLNNFVFYLENTYLGRVRSFNPFNVSFIDENKVVRSFSKFDPIIDKISIHNKTID
ncbi:hypothetical protein [Morganella morganii]|uniref:hypothetical protein n=1 Tax=Morganella morganii TaxID=582 RepID=UPI00197B83C7|nr:hypothetical protein [Morganella morganii]